MLVRLASRQKAAHLSRRLASSVSSRPLSTTPLHWLALYRNELRKQPTSLFSCKLNSASASLLPTIRSFSSPPPGGGRFPGQSWVNPENEVPGKHLEQYSVDLTKMAQDNKLDPVIGRHEEIRRTLQILARRTKNNPVLIGEPGVGKVRHKHRMIGVLAMCVCVVSTFYRKSAI